MGKIICIDAGHGGKDSGAINKSRYEKDDTLRMAFALKDELIANGFTVILTRTTDEYVSLAQRTNFANAKKADYFISIHRNSFINDSANGIETWIYQSTDKDTQQAATLIQKEVVAVSAQSDRGVKKGNFHVTRESNMPACLLELNFISNTKDNALFDNYFEKYAAAIAKALCQYFGMVYFVTETATGMNNPASPKPNQPAKKPTYRVQIGAFENKENANKLQNELKAKGYSAIIV